MTAEHTGRGYQASGGSCAGSWRRRAVPILSLAAPMAPGSPMSLLSHRATRGLASQLLAPLVAAAVLVLAVLGAVLTLDARQAARDGLRSEERRVGKECRSRW